MQAIKFKNFTTEDFVWKYDGIPYTFKAGQEIYLEDFKAHHFAGHLVDLEMNRLGVPTNTMNRREELLKQCFPSDEVITPSEALQINEKEKVTKKTKKVEKEFEDLNN